MRYAMRLRISSGEASTFGISDFSRVTSEVWLFEIEWNLPSVLCTPTSNGVSYFARPRMVRPSRVRTDTPFEGLPQGRDLLVDPFVLHLGFDGWQAVRDKPSVPLPFGRHGVRLTPEDFAHWNIVNFTFYFPDRDRWQVSDFHVRIA